VYHYEWRIFTCLFGAFILGNLKLILILIGLVILLAGILYLKISKNKFKRELKKENEKQREIIGDAKDKHENISNANNIDFESTSDGMFNFKRKRGKFHSDSKGD